MTDFRLVDKKGLKTIYGIPYCSQYIAVLEKAGKFPKRVRLGACRVAWYCSEIEAWIASRPSLTTTKRRLLPRSGPRLATGGNSFSVRREVSRCVVP